MKFFSNIKLFAVIFFLLSLSVINISIAQEKPLLSEAIRKAIDTKGIEAAKKHFADMDQSERENYDIDMQGISELTNTYVKSENIEAASAVSEIAAPFMRDMISKSYGGQSGNMAEKIAEQRRKDKEEKTERHKERREEEKQRRQQQIIDFQGQPRDDLKRFTGLYGDPAKKDSKRKLWVTVSCDGYLVSGALWGDVAPWWLKSEGDNVFTYSHSMNNLRMEFKTDENGKALRMIHNLEGMKNPLERLGPLPDDWDPCMERPRR